MSKKLKFLALILLSVLLSTNFAWGTDETATWTASSGALGSGIGSGTITDNKSNSWSYTRTLSSGSSYTGWTSNCIQLGKNGGVENLTISTSAYNSYTIKSVAVECSSYQAKHNVAITVGSTTYLSSTATPSWTTVDSKSGTGTSSGTITISFTGGSRALYIKSITVTYEAGSTKTLVYNANGATGGSVPTDAAAYNVGDKATVLGNTGSLTKVGYTWSGWNTAADGSGDPYDAGAEFTISSSGNTLYAQWTNTYAGQEFSLVEDLNDLSDGSKIIILDKDYATAMSTTRNDNNIASVAATNTQFAMSNSNKTVTLGSATTVQVITLEDLATPAANTYQFNVEEGKYLYAASSSNNYMKVQDTNDANGHWLIGLSSGTFSVVAQGTNTNKTMQKNNSSAFFSCYSSASQKNVLIYFKDEGTKYTITWANGGHGTAPTSPTSASRVTLPELSADGWQHDGWKANQDVTNVATGATISSGTLITNGTRVILGANTTFTAQWRQICATPTFTVSEGTYNAAQTVSISCATPSGTTIRYTTDGSTPTSSSGTVYSGSISVSVSQTVKAIAYKDGCVDSEVASATYTLKCATPTFTPTGGTKSGAQSVTISCTSEGATIYYTTDGSTPTNSSTEYSGAISVTESETIKAIAIIAGWTNSDVASAAYTINYTVTWMVNGTTWSSGVSSSNNNANWNTKISAMPTAPDVEDYCGARFMGWTTTNIGSTGLDKTDDAAAITALSLFTDVAGSPAITDDTTFYAVFADYGE